MARHERDFTRTRINLVMRPTVIPVQTGYWNIKITQKALLNRDKDMVPNSKGSDLFIIPISLKKTNAFHWLNSKTVAALKSKNPWNNYPLPFGRWNYMDAMIGVHKAFWAIWFSLADHGNPAAMFGKPWQMPYYCIWTHPNCGLFDNPLLHKTRINGCAMHTLSYLLE